ncbi:MAG: putative RNA 2'-phosphotransferase [Maribacter sp.]|jgi:putative RNA 2'-phosphotransferase
MQNKHVKNISKFLSLVLRHKPQVIGLNLDKQGWTSVEELLEKLTTHKKGITMSELEWIVENNNKKRFAFNEDKTRIRANQGHSLTLDLGYEAVEPPEFLYHGTATRFIDSIKKTGLEKRNRYHLHLSQELDTATSVGGRHGKSIILIIKSKEMHQAGHDFFVSENGVWLTDHVPLNFIDFSNVG